jgi:polyhydroxyalkanoate synthesis regulator phasin
MKTFALAALTIMVGTFIANIKATVPLPVQQTHDTYQDLPSRAEVKQFDDHAETIASNIDRLQKQVADLPDEIAALHSRDNAFGNRQDEFDKRLCAVEAKYAGTVGSSDVGAKLTATEERVTRLLQRIEQLEAKGTYQSVGYVVSSSASNYGSVGGGSVGGGSVGGGSAGSYPTFAKTPAVTSPQKRTWTYPGSITNHLQSDHGVSTAGLTIEQQKSLHDSLHESQSVQSQSRSSTSTSSCPGGVCPAPGSQRRGLLGFGRR